MSESNSILTEERPKETDKMNNYLTSIQYNKICKYWRFIHELSYKLEHFDYSDDDEEAITDSYFEKVKEKLNYQQQEYEKYIISIGFELGNRTYDEKLFDLLNNGIV